MSNIAGAAVAGRFILVGQEVIQTGPWTTECHPTIAYNPSTDQWDGLENVDDAYLRSSIFPDDALNYTTTWAAVEHEGTMIVFSSRGLFQLRDNTWQPLCTELHDGKPRVFGRPKPNPAGNFFSCVGSIPLY